MAIVETFRGTSGSQYVYYKSTDPTPPGLTDVILLHRQEESDILWEWNGEDTIQFDTSAPTFANDFSSGSLTVVDAPLAPSGKALVLSGSGGSGADDGVLVFSATSSLQTNRFVAKYYLQEVEGDGSPTAGFAFLCESSGSDFHGHVYTQRIDEQTQVGWHTQIESGSVDSEEITESSAISPRETTVEISGSKLTGSQPYFSCMTRGGGGTLGGNSYHLNDIWPYSGSWNPLVLRNFGLALSRGIACGMMIYYVVVKKHPLDT
jgi:hypothetical protein